jgi:hypothetical protein
MRHKIISRLCNQYRTMTPEDYLFNQRDATLAKRPHVKTLTPL